MQYRNEYLKIPKKQSVYYIYSTHVIVNLGFIKCMPCEFAFEQISETENFACVN